MTRLDNEPALFVTERRHIEDFQGVVFKELPK